MATRPPTQGNQVKPYGDTTGDGAMQLSFTLPVADAAKAREAARQLCLKMGIADAAVAYTRDLGGGFTFCIVYGHSLHTVDLDAIAVTEVAAPDWDLDEIDRLVREKIGRPVVVVGACTGSDAHTVGLDAILNAKGFHGHYGLERLAHFRVHNLGAQVPNEVLVAKALEVGADAILVSKVVTQKNIHLTDMTQLVDLLEAEGIRDQVILVAGGPRMSHELAVELGYDAGFGPGTVAARVGAFLVQELLRRSGAAG